LKLDVEGNREGRRTAGSALDESFQFIGGRLKSPILLGYGRPGECGQDTAMHGRQIPHMAQLAALIGPILMPMQKCDRGTDKQNSR